MAKAINGKGSEVGLEITPSRRQGAPTSHSGCRTARHERTAPGI